MPSLNIFSKYNFDKHTLKKYFKDRVQCSPDWLGTCCVTHDDSELLSCFYLLSARITGVCHHVQFCVLGTSHMLSKCSTNQGTSLTHEAFYIHTKLVLEMLTIAY